MTSSVDVFFARSRERARKLDRGEKIPAEVRVVLEDPTDLMQVLSADRIRLLHAVRYEADTYFATGARTEAGQTGGDARCAAAGVARVAEDAGGTESGARQAENRRAVGRPVSTGGEYLRIAQSSDHITPTRQPPTDPKTTSPAYSAAKSIAPDNVSDRIPGGTRLLQPSPCPLRPPGTRYSWPPAARRAAG